MKEPTLLNHKLSVAAHQALDHKLHIQTPMNPKTSQTLHFTPILPSADNVSKLRPRTLDVGGVVAFTATDYPGKLAAVVFVQGCPWNCTYCQNPHLQARKPADTVPCIPWTEVMGLLKRRVGLIDAVVFSGGEPTMDPALPDAIAEVRQLGYKFGLHTACIYPRQLNAILPLIDWIGFDIKTAFDDYERITGIPNSGSQVSDCLDAILASGVAHECRTTIHPYLQSEAELIALAEVLAQRGVKNYIWQLYRPHEQGCASAGAAQATTAPVPGNPLQGDLTLNTRMPGYPSVDTVCHTATLFSQFSVRRASY